MATVLPVHKVVGVIDFPGDIPGIIARAKEISGGCAVSTRVAIDPLVIAAIDETIKNYEFAEPGNRAGMYGLMNNAIQEKLLAPFQAAANADPINSIVILQSGKFHIKDQYIPQIHVFGGVAGTAAGTVDLVTEGGPQGEAHLHQWYSSQDGVIFKREQATNGAQTTLGGFISGQQAHFMEELSIKDVLQGRSQIISIWVK